MARAKARAARTLKDSSAFSEVDEAVKRRLKTLNTPVNPATVTNNYGEAMAYVAGARYLWETFVHGELIEGAIEALKQMEAEAEAAESGKGSTLQES